MLGQNKIPVFCPALTDGSLGDMLWSHSYKAETPLVIDLVQDIRRINDLSMYAKKAGMVILGGGVCKHQIANSMLFVRRALISATSDRVSSATERTTPCTSIRGKSSTDPIAVHGQTKPSAGARSAQGPSPSKSTRTPPSSSHCS
jgi:hypothetical protein